MLSILELQMVSTYTCMHLIENEFQPQQQKVMMSYCFVNCFESIFRTDFPPILWDFPKRDPLGMQILSMHRAVSLAQGALCCIRHRNDFIQSDVIFRLKLHQIQCIAHNVDATARYVLRTYSILHMYVFVYICISDCIKLNMYTTFAYQFEIGSNSNKMCLKYIARRKSWYDGQIIKSYIHMYSLDQILKHFFVCIFRRLWIIQ